MLLGVTTLGMVIGTWVLAVTTERGQHITAWAAHFLGLLVLIVIVLSSILISLGFMIRSIGV
jgi:hypothetical protein